MKVVKFKYRGMLNSHADASHSWYSRIDVEEGEICLQVEEGVLSSPTPTFSEDSKYIVPVFLSSGQFAYAICAGKIGWEMWTEEL